VKGESRSVGKGEAGSHAQEKSPPSSDEGEKPSLRSERMVIRRINSSGLVQERAQRGESERKSRAPKPKRRDRA